MQTQCSKMLRFLGIALTVLASSILASSQEPASGTWTKLAHQPTFETDTALMLTDGTVMMHQYNSGNWWRLTPTNTGSYVNGTWTQLASMQAGYAPLYFASVVLPDGRVLVEGGEYNNLQGVETNLGDIYDPTTNTWTAVNPPTGWRTIGDSPGVVLPNGTFMMGQGGQPSTQQVLFDATSLTWTAVTGAGKADGFSEEGFALTPQGNVLVVDTEHGTNSELYNPTTAKWTTAGSTIVTLPNSGNLGIVPEMGPLIQRPDGTIVGFGATTHTSIFNTTNTTWTQGPDYPSGDDMADGPGAILPDGNILVYTSPGVFQGTGTFYEFTTSNTFATAPNTVSGAALESWEGRLLVLPTGQILYAAADGASIDVELYTHTGTVNNAWRPKITSVPSTVTHGDSYTLSGTQLNGLSAGATYGDDAQMATSFPFVVIRNNATKHFFFARTHNFSTMGIATGSTVVSTSFDVPSSIETGASTVYVVANGIPSAGKPITVN
ncbi:MAG TPA: kelch repeat-containing protein [Terriglobales bacterium]|nr:kelch repeat-containing protein [Terriglobales bacterium]